jgi:hypothetical protein
MTGSAPAKATDKRPLVVCLAEDRQSCECAVRVLIASLNRHCPGLPIQFFAPNPTPAFRAWLATRPDVTLNDQGVQGGLGGFDIKPQALTNLLERGFEEILWIDADIVVVSDFRAALAKHAPDVFITTEEAQFNQSDDTALPTRLWGMPVGRPPLYTVNSGVVRVNRRHLPLLKRWMELLANPDYRASQKKNWRERPLHHLGDQEVLAGVLGAAEFADIPLVQLRCGKDIVQYFRSTGYRTMDRLRHIFGGKPYFFHALGYKPWLVPPPPQGHGFGDKFNRLYQDASPYMVHASRYGAELESTDWLKPRSTGVRILRWLSFGNPALVGLPLAILGDLIWAARKVRNKRTEASALETA